MAEKGFILLHRKFWDNPILNTGERFNHYCAWLWLITHANHTEKTITIRGSVYKIQRGQMFASVRKLAEIWGWNKDTVLQTLNLLEREKMILKTRTQNGTLITILNYRKYQEFHGLLPEDPDTEPDTEPDTDPDTGPPQLNNDRKNDERMKKENSARRVIE